MDRATLGLPSNVQDCSYCCEPSTTLATSRSRTMPVAGGNVVELLVVLAVESAPCSCCRWIPRRCPDVLVSLAGRVPAGPGLDDDVAELLRVGQAGPRY